MPTKKERDYYSLGFRDGMAYERDGSGLPTGRPMFSSDTYSDISSLKRGGKRTRKLSSWQKFIKANSNKKKFKYANGKLKLKTMGIAYRKTAAYKRNRKKK